MYNYRDVYEQYQLDKLKKLPQMIKFAEDIISGNETYGMESNLFFGIWQDVLYLLQNKEATRHDFSAPCLYRVLCDDKTNKYAVIGEKVLGTIFQQVFNLRIYMGVSRTDGFKYENDSYVRPIFYLDTTKKKVYSIYPFERSDTRFESRELIECLDDLEIINNDDSMHFYEFGNKYKELELYGLENSVQERVKAIVKNIDIPKLRNKYLTHIGSEGEYTRRSQEEILEIEEKIKSFNNKALLLNVYKLKITVGLLETTLTDIEINGEAQLIIPNFINVISLDIGFKNFAKTLSIRNKELLIPESVSVITSINCIFIKMILHDGLKYIGSSAFKNCRNNSLSFNPQNKNEIFIDLMDPFDHLDELSFNKNVTGMVRVDYVSKKLYIEEGSSLKVFSWFDNIVNIPEFDIPEEQFIGCLHIDNYKKLEHYISIWEEKTGRKFNKQKQCYKDALVTIAKKGIRAKIGKEVNEVLQLDNESIMVLEKLLEEIN